MNITFDQRKALRNGLIREVADEFIASKVEYTCGAVVLKFAEPRIAAKLAEDRFGPVRHRSEWRADKIAKSTWDEIHARWKATR